MTTEDDECAICALSLKEMYCDTLSCTHVFHYECLLKTFIANKRATYKHTNRCPYCRTPCGYLAPINGLTKLIGKIHYNPEEPIPECPKIRCQHVLLRGFNKGKTCDKKCQLGFVQCKTHHSKSPKI